MITNRMVKVDNDYEQSVDVEWENWMIWQWFQQSIAKMLIIAKWL